LIFSTLKSRIKRIFARALALEANLMDSGFADLFAWGPAVCE
jgi:hypothetical protein